MLITPVLGELDQCHAAPARGWRRWTSRRASKPAGDDEARTFAERLSWSLECARERRTAGDSLPVRVPEPAREARSTPEAAHEGSRDPMAAAASVLTRSAEPVLPTPDPTNVSGPEPATPEDVVAESPGERRAHRRYASHELQGLCAARIRSGPSVSIIDVSAGGVLLESDEPLRAASQAVLELFGWERDLAVAFRVVRCQVSAMHGSPCYRAACEFTEPADLLGLLQAGLSAPRQVADTGRDDDDADRADRRRHLRVNGPFDGRRLGLIDTPIVISDLSEGGCFLDSLIAAEPGCRLNLGIAVPGEAWITVSAVVVHGRPGYGFAVQFVDVSEATRAALARLVASTASTAKNSGPPDAVLGPGGTTTNAVA
jgi:hypothetical protein